MHNNRHTFLYPRQVHVVICFACTNVLQDLDSFGSAHAYYIALKILHELHTCLPPQIVIKTRIHVVDRHRSTSFKNSMCNE
jgi:hypothetical protein